MRTLDLSFNRLSARTSNVDGIGGLFPALRELKLYDTGIEQLPLLDKCVHRCQHRRTPAASRPNPAGLVDWKS